MTKKSTRQTVIAAMFGASLALLVLATGCSAGMDGSMGGNQNITAGSQVLHNGIIKARAGIAQYQAGDTTGGLSTIHQGRDMMGQGVVTMGLGCCMSDGGVLVDDGGTAAGCASKMGTGATPMMQGLANFDAAHKTMMASSDAGTGSQAMADMETGMQMMDQGAGQMMGGTGSMGTMSGM